MILHKGYGRGRRGAGFGQKQFLHEEYAQACQLYGKTFVDLHIEAMRGGRTKVTIRELILNKNKQKKKK